MSRVVLVTGVSRDLGARLARSLAAHGQHEVIGVDLTPPKRDLGAVKFVRADLRGPALPSFLARHGVHTVVHCGLLIEEAVASPAAAKESNILGTMQLVAACQQAPGVRHVVLRSSGWVYGASPLDPARFAEDTVPRRPPRMGPAKHALEMESFVLGLAQRRPEVAVTILRLSSLLGGHVDSSLSRWLSLPVVPRPLGFNARLQFLHPADAVRALQVVVERDLPGTFNVAAEDAVTLTQVLRILGRPAIGIAGNSPALLALGRRAKFIRFTSDQVRAMTWGGLLDTRRFEQVADFAPVYSSRRAVEEFAAFTTPGMLDAERIDRAIDQVRRVLSPAVQAPTMPWPRGVRGTHG